MIGVTDDEWSAQTLTGVAVREGAARTGLDLSLERGIVVRGRVAYRPTGSPRPGGTLRLAEQVPGSRGPARSARTASQRNSTASPIATRMDGSRSGSGRATTGRSGPLPTGGAGPNRAAPGRRRPGRGAGFPSPAPVVSAPSDSRPRAPGDARRPALADAVVRIGSHDDNFLRGRRLRRQSRPLRAALPRGPGRPLRPQHGRPPGRLHGLQPRGRRRAHGGGRSVGDRARSGRSTSTASPGLRSLSATPSRRGLRTRTRSPSRPSSRRSWPTTKAGSWSQACRSAPFASSTRIPPAEPTCPPISSR